MSWENLVMFPGVISHELAHLLACLVTGTKVSGVKLWGLDEAWVKHEEPGPFSMVLIAVAPLILNTLLSLFFIYIGDMYVLSHKVYYSLVSYWLGLSFAYHAFPSLDDVNNAYSVFLKNWLSAMVGKKGIIKGILAWILFIPVFIPMLGLIGIMYIFSQVEYLGLVWFVLLFLGLASYLGI